MKELDTPYYRVKKIYIQKHAPYYIERSKDTHTNTYSILHRE